jgi:hypothetical protein
MNTETILQDLAQEFELTTLPKEEQEEMLFELAKAVHNQFLLDIHATLGEEQFSALEASSTMGDEFYLTTLKHLIPNYEELFTQARTKIVAAYKKANPSVI